MAPKPQKIRDEYTAELLLMAAEQSTDPRRRKKYRTLASVRSGSLIPEGLPPRDRATVFRWMRELNDLPGPDYLLEPPSPGPENPEVDTHISPAELRAFAETEPEGPYKTGLLTFAILVETQDVDKATEAGFTKQHIQKLIPRFNKSGIDGLKSPTIDEAGIGLIRSMLANEDDDDTRNKLEALLAFATEGLSKNQINGRFGIPPGTFDGHLKKFALRGADAFVSRALRNAKNRVDPQAAELLLRVAKNAIDPVTTKRCGAVGDCLNGEDRLEVAKRYSTVGDKVTLWMRTFETHGISALVGQREFVAAGRETDVPKTLYRLARAEHDETKRELLQTCADFHFGMPMKMIRSRYKGSVDDLHALLWALQEAHFQNASDVVTRHFAKRI